MKGVGWEADGSLDITQAKRAGQLLSDVSTVLCLCARVSYHSKQCVKTHFLFFLDEVPSESRQHRVHPGGRRSGHPACQKEPGAAERRKRFHSEAVNILQIPRGASSLMSDCHFQLAYKANTEQMLHQYTMTKDEPLFRQAKANADLLSAVSSGNLI